MGAEHDLSDKQRNQFHNDWSPDEPTLTDVVDFAVEHYQCLTEEELKDWNYSRGFIMGQVQQKFGTGWHFDVDQHLQDLWESR